MATALKVVGTHDVFPGSSLAKKELLLAQATESWGESYFRMGVVLRSIYDDENWKEAEYTSFNEYMNDRQPCGINARRGQQLMSAADRRTLLPDINGDEQAVHSVWTEAAIRPLTHKDFARADVRRIGKKIATRVKRGEKLTSTLVKEICDDERGVVRRKTIKKEKIFKQASLAKNLKLAIEMVIGLRVGFENYYEDAWDEVEDANPGLIRGLITEIDNLTSFLKG